jgi:UDP-N-acetylmuramoyl-tripeptide--D-alanyl-D-alanine ligase
MSAPLWNEFEICTVTGAEPETNWNGFVTGISIDTRTLQPGDLFVALKDVRDGHEFVTAAFKAGAPMALVKRDYERKDGDRELLRADDPLGALEKLGIAARARLSATARVIAVTGSAGKTGTKEMLRACLSRLGKVHASEKSYNNHWGVPLTLARMPRDTDYAVFEIGMNHAGEITPLTQMVRPHAAIVTTVEAVHLAHFGSVEEIADAKAEIFSGLIEGGTAIIKRDSPHYDRLRVRAAAHGALILSFGLDARADVRAENLSMDEDGSEIVAHLPSGQIKYRLAMPGRHIAENSLAVASALSAIGADVEKALAALADLPPPGGRGERTTLSLAGGAVLLIDESYNANPASMRAALETMARVPRSKFPRRIAVLGDMLELGPGAGELHRGLKASVDEAGADLVFACGRQMRHLFDALRPEIQGGAADSATALEAPLLAALQPGDVVMVKASNGTRVWALVETMKRRFGEKRQPV